MGVVFAKTARGQEEMATRSGGLSPRVRRVLILIDGKRDVDQLREMVQSDDLTHTLGELEEAGYIEPVALADTAGGAVAVDGSLPPITAFRELPATPVTPELELARNFMINTLKTFFGPYEKLSIIEPVFVARSHEEMRQYFDVWYAAIVSSRDGRRRAEELRTRLLQVI